MTELRFTILGCGSSGGVPRLGPANENGDARSEKCGSVMRLTPPSCSRKVACPTQVSVGSLPLARRVAGLLGASGKVISRGSGLLARHFIKSLNGLLIALPSELVKVPSAAWCGAAAAGAAAAACAADFDKGKNGSAASRDIKRRRTAARPFFRDMFRDMAGKEFKRLPLLRRL